jgi:hypothetical protein
VKQFQKSLQNLDVFVLAALREELKNQAMLPELQYRDRQEIFSKVKMIDDLIQHKMAQLEKGERQKIKECIG